MRVCRSQKPASKKNKWFVKRSHFVVDETETEYLVLGYDEDDEPDADTDYNVCLGSRTNRNFHEFILPTYDGDSAERNLLNGEISSILKFLFCLIAIQYPSV